ncbi:hypothetical protein AB6E04_10665 [Vibrio amylolyticus]|uniref:hypothetical protein n=1 Tax=Vibrio amylolyticus TaxID=2847292 RepID=UPI0035507A24
MRRRKEGKRQYIPNNNAGGISLNSVEQNVEVLKPTGLMHKLNETKDSRKVEEKGTPKYSNN